MVIQGGCLIRLFGDFMTIYAKIDPNRELVAGVGSALVDILAHEDDAFLQRSGAIKGGMTYVDNGFIDATVGRTHTQPMVVPGGSACNTMVGIGRLGGRARFVGKCGHDAMGLLFRTELQKQQVEALLFGSDAPTGRVLSIITPDAQRSMLTYLGASSEIQAQEITPACFENAAIVHVEGYLLFNPDLILSVLRSARQAGARVSLDLASFNVVEAAKDILPDLIAEYVDILIANEDEALAYTGIQDEQKALDALAARVDIAVLKQGARGSLIAHGGDRVKVNCRGDGTAVDTTGAGDLWASGFLYGLVHGLELMQCGNLGSWCGHAVCQVVGAHISDSQWLTIQKVVEEQWPKNV
jgi:sugar/nucleoside kinase (ribokinase family)